MVVKLKTYSVQQKGQKISGSKGIPDSILILLVTIFLFTVLSGNIFLFKLAKEKTAEKAPEKTLAGRATTQGITSICIGGRSIINITSPNEFAVLEGNISVNVTATVDNENFSYVEIYLSFTRPGAADNFTLIGNSTSDGNNNFGITYNTANLSDGCCFYKIKAIAHGVCTAFTETKLKLTVDNTPEPPDYTEFNNSLSTNLSARSNWRNIPNLTLAKPGIGIIRFLENVTVDGYNLSQSIEISDKRIEINTSLLPCLTRKAQLTFFNVTFQTPQILVDGQPCSSPRCILESFSNNTYVVNVSSFSVYTITTAHVPVVNAFDETEAAGGNYVRYVYQDVKLFANQSYADDGTPVIGTGVYCTVNLSTGSSNTIVTLPYNSTLELYTGTVQFQKPGIYPWNVSCNSTVIGYGIVNDSDNVTITNRPPVYVLDLPHVSWPKDTIINAFDLDNYFREPDGEKMTYSSSFVQNIDINISDNGLVQLTPDTGFTGTRYAVFYAFDPGNLSAVSNITNLTVVATSSSSSNASSSSAASSTTSTSSGGSSITIFIQGCLHNWSCTKWSDCKPLSIGVEDDVVEDSGVEDGGVEDIGVEGIITRKCTYVGTCPVQLRKPSEIEPCVYIPTCDDKIKNSDETGVDCGGRCPACPTCTDGIQNGGESGIDCGGPCITPCPSCSDGLQNQDEEGVDCGAICGNKCATCNDGRKNGHERGVDCGGSCPPCQQPSPAQRLSPYIIAALAILASLTFVFSLRHAVRFAQAVKATMAKPENKEDILLTVFDKLELAYHKSGSNPEQAVTDMTALLATYIKRLYGIEEELTIDELVAKLEERHASHAIIAQIKALAVKESEMRYSGIRLTSKDANQFRGTIKNIVESVYKSKGMQIIKSEAKKAQKTKSTFKGAFTISLLKKKILVAEGYAKSGNMQKANDIYENLLQDYKKLGLEERKQLYLEIIELHSKISKVSQKSTKARK